MLPNIVTVKEALGDIFVYEEKPDFIHVMLGGCCVHHLSWTSLTNIIVLLCVGFVLQLLEGVDVNHACVCANIYVLGWGHCMSMSI